MRSVLLFASTLLLASPASSQAPQVPARQIGSATLENVPAIPADVREAVQRYQNYREAELQDWLPDGSLLISTRFGATRQLHRVAAPGAARTQLTFFAEPVAGAWTIPGTGRVLLSRDTGGDEWFQLYVLAPGDEPVAITEKGTRNENPVFSRDGRLVVWSRAVKGSADRAIMIADPVDPPSRRLALQAEGAVEPADVSPDGRRILLTRTLSNREHRLSVLHLPTGRLEPVAATAEPARWLGARFSGDGRTILARTDRGSDVLRLVRLDPQSGAIEPLSPESRWDVEAFEPARDGRTLAIAFNEEGYSRLVLQDLGGRTLPQPVLPRGILTGLEFSPSGTSLALSLTAAATPGDVWTWDVAKGGLTRWTRSELGGLDPAQLAEPELIRFTSFDGLSVPAFVYRPRGLAPRTKTPVIVDIHGGPESQTRPVWNPGAQYFADVLGATVILPNVRGSTGYGTRYLNLDNAEKREDSVRDVGALLDWIARQPDLDAERVAVYGQSYGGYMALASMIHHGERLVGGVERYGISNWVSFLRNTEAYRRDNRRGEYGDERDPAMRAVLERISPLARVGRIEKPMLVMQGANDPRVPQSESDQVVREIRTNGTEAWYVLFADEGHGFLKKPNNDLRREVETVFLRRLFKVNDPEAKRPADR